MRAIDLNADLGEGFGPWSMTDDAGLMQIISSANMACGFHAGDPNHMARVCELAKVNQVCLGAHPGFDDKANFGRRRIELSRAELCNMLAYQIGAACAVASVNGVQIRYVKAHGALANMAAESSEVADALMTAIRSVDASLAVMAIGGSQQVAAANRLNMTVIHEAFIDRRYTDELQLAPRYMAGAVLEDLPTMLRQVDQLLDGEIETISGERMALHCDSLCLHGDGEHAVHVAEAVKTHILSKGHQIAATLS
ncbi:MAG: LamB/YcsF family protein [Gammaproteobacteria bacterium]|nr:LamB/YcsF family protein [Gammaproteobacteria bacterium]